MIGFDRGCKFKCDGYNEIHLQLLYKEILKRMIDLQNLSVNELAAYSLSDLNAIKDNVTKAIELRKSNDKKELISKLKTMAEESGLPLSELVSELQKISASSTKLKKEKAPPKFRNPHNAEQTWSGNGRMPKWLADEVANGKSENDFLITDHQ